MELNPIEVRGLKYSYNKYAVLDGVDLEIKEGEILGILGPNGCGKTTLLKNLNKNLSPAGGCVMLDGTDLETIAKRDIAKTVAVVPQTNEIRFSFTVREIVSMGRMPFQSMMGGESREDAAIIDDAIEKVGLTHLADRHINTMSGGERQRVMIARALAQTPKILLMDEPTLHLDINTQLEALDLVYELSKKSNLTVAIVSHDLPMVARYCDRIAMIHDHKVMCCGTPEEILTPENMRIVFNVDAELGYDSKNGKRTVFLHGVAGRD
ncbi:MAG: ABC transporter ATP-binding protein [Candidatus Methanomethylophilaceae archaeon]|nr:ABC transporter ATP-binding protein [Candidatus Methanomethylophilaceae archaeon]